jgi:predicted dehydrogenase/nucleoside-diphosphate-sugar epimerase
MNSSAIDQRISERSRLRRVALVGAGNIAFTHAEVLHGLKGVEIAAVVDPRLDRASALANRFKAKLVDKSLESLLRREEIDAVHILTPPDRHADLAITALTHNVSALIEKPLAGNVGACDELISAHNGAGQTTVYVNHNFLFHPAFRRLMSAVAERTYGQMTAVTCTFAMPLRQLAAHQFHHWMFRAPANLLLEQAIHPLSQLITLAGPAERWQVLAGPPRAVGSDRQIPTSLSGQLRCRDCDVQVHLQFGASFPLWQISVLCTDGVLMADIVRNRFIAQERTKWLEPLDYVLDSRRVSKALRQQALHGLYDYTRSLFRLAGRSDPFYASMCTSLGVFHGASLEPTPWVNRPEGARRLVALCEAIASEAYSTHLRTSTLRPSPSNKSHDFTVIGATGFIGHHIISALLKEGATVGVVARHLDLLPPSFQSPRLHCFEGDIRNQHHLAPALEGARYVINATAPELGETWADCERETRSAIESLVDACLATRVARLVHLGSTAALYLGAPGVSVNGRTPPDPKSDRRSLYARSKALADLLLLVSHEERDLPVCILRPAIAVGEGGTPFHSGVGLFVSDQHCIGWNRGENPLPFVLARDVAQAVISACRRPGLEGQCYNLAGDVRLTAREYVNALGKALGRPLSYHPQSTAWLYTTELGKWFVKRIAGRVPPLPSLRDLRSRGFLSVLDCTDAKADLGWRPVSDRETFFREALAVHARAGVTSL